MWHLVSSVWYKCFQWGGLKFDTTMRIVTKNTQQAHTHVHRHTAAWNVKVYWLPFWQPSPHSLLSISDMSGDGWVLERNPQSCLPFCLSSLLFFSHYLHLYLGSDRMWLEYWTRHVLGSCFVHLTTRLDKVSHTVRIWTLHVPHALWAHSEVCQTREQFPVTPPTYGHAPYLWPWIGR